MKSNQLLHKTATNRFLLLYQPKLIN